MQTDYDDEVAFHAVRFVHELARSRRGEPFFLTVSFAAGRGRARRPWRQPNGVARLAA